MVDALGHKQLLVVSCRLHLAFSMCSCVCKSLVHFAFANCEGVSPPSLAVLESRDNVKRIVRRDAWRRQDLTFVCFVVVREEGKPCNNLHAHLLSCLCDCLFSTLDNQERRKVA